MHCACHQCSIPSGCHELCGSPLLRRRWRVLLDLAGKEHWNGEVPLCLCRLREQEREMRYKLTVQYDGTRFAGSQRQRDTPTTQNALEDAVSVFGKDRIPVVFAGRTDAGASWRLSTAYVSVTDLCAAKRIHVQQASTPSGHVRTWTLSAATAKQGPRSVSDVPLPSVRSRCLSLTPHGRGRHFPDVHRRSRSRPKSCFVRSTRGFGAAE